MFYSQFILAKKGPLGTIWIAAHLERKLRKNQVADTDIGVSVDSILFPDVPIALRLSSHLLLGVVRIYSRKVNYLFDDCSEALLKIKQAFRSTAVDLPPEESTAPYHSITLPETFDLDDFELPDNDMFKGNYVDHHISTRDQITLQDTMEGVVYSTSQFGLDERFGDGDTSQAGLDLEEELLLENATVTGHDQVSENDAQASVEPVPHLETYGSHERMAGSSEDMPLNGTINKVPDIDEDFEIADYADAPCTPGLVEPNVSSVKEGLGCDDHLELEESNLRELMGKTDSITGESNSHREDAMEFSLGENVNHDTLPSMPAEDNHLSGELEINQASAGEFLSEAVTTKHIPADETVFTPNESPKLEDKGEVVSCNSKQTMSSMDQVNGECEVLGIGSHKTDNVEIGCDIEVPHSNGNATIATTLQSTELSVAQDCVNVESQECPGQESCEMPNDNDKHNEQTVPISSCFLRQCNSHTSELNVESLSLNKAEREEGDASGNSTKVQGEECHVSDGIQSAETRMSEHTLNGENLEDQGKQDKEPDDLISRDNQCEDLNTSMTSELSAPEKLLCAPPRPLDEPHDMLIETPEKEVQEEGGGSEAGTTITGKKRPFSESALTVQTLDSVDSFGLARSKETVESIPDDDDLLSSILAGRKSSFMKIKPSPPAREPPSKRARSSASRPSAMKRKVLMDDSMVLHGETIRQQLTSTEDIRRLRKKAPCTHTEILMIQRQFLQVEIFNEPVLSGMSVELTHLHNEEFDLSRVRVCENDGNTQASIELVDAGNPGCKNASRGEENEGGINVVTSTNDAVGQPLEFSVENGIQQVEDQLSSLDINFQNNRNCIAEEMDFRSSVVDNLGESIEMESCRKNLGESGEISELPTDTVDQSAPTVGSMQRDAPSLLADNIAIQLSDVAHFMSDTGNEVSDAVDQSAEKRVLDTTEFRTEEEIPLEETKISASDERVDGCTLNDDIDGSRANVPALDGGCSDLNFVNVDQNLEDAENDKNRVCNDDVGLVVSSGCISDKDQNPNTLCDDESKIDPICSVELEGDVKTSPVNHGDHVTGVQFMEDTQDSLHHVTLGDCDDIQCAPFPNDTEFLNVDDDEIGEDDDEGMPNTEDTPRLLENTGWSSRTRAVARYLQTLFDKESEHGRKGVSIDSLLAGKTRKEASRMFFETLVLKTRDYVQVEQPQPYDSINIKPRSKLMISDF